MSERFDLAVPTESMADPRVAALLGTLEGDATRQSGYRIAEVV